jgi:hypothetical protein
MEAQWQLMTKTQTLFLVLAGSSLGYSCKTRSIHTSLVQNRSQVRTFLPRGCPMQMHAEN